MYNLCSYIQCRIDCMYRRELWVKKTIRPAHVRRTAHPPSGHHRYCTSHAFPGLAGGRIWDLVLARVLAQVLVLILVPILALVRVLVLALVPIPARVLVLLLVLIPALVPVLVPVLVPPVCVLDRRFKT